MIAMAYLSNGQINNGAVQASIFTCVHLCGWVLGWGAELTLLAAFLAIFPGDL